jgi:hypothetical protein
MSTNENGIKGFLVLDEFLKKNEWDAEKTQEEYAFKAWKDDNELCSRTYFFQIKVDLEQFLFYIVPDIVLLPEMLSSCAEYITRANSGMRIGNFEISYEDCRVSFRSSINFKGDRLSEALIEGAILPALEAFDGYFAGLARVATGINTPVDAIYLVEYGE